MTGIAVIVGSRGGNTRKVAEAIAAEAGTAAGDIAAPLPQDTGILFPGSVTCGGAPGIAMMKFVTDNDFTARKVALFGTSGGAGGAGRMIAALEAALKRKGATVAGTFSCPGQVFFFLPRQPGRSRPGECPPVRPGNVAEALNRKGTQELSAPAPGIILWKKSGEYRTGTSRQPVLS